MSKRSVEDNLREEYFELLPVIRIIKEKLEAKVRYLLLPLLDDLKEHERYEVTSRVKECESAINSLIRHQESDLFDQEQPKKYSLTQLKDLAGVRILVFPRSLMHKVEDLVKKKFINWEPDHIPYNNDAGDNLALKYNGHFTSEKRIYGEIQIVSMLTGLFWEVEHKAIYKPKPTYRHIAESHEMLERRQDVYKSLKAFEETFESLCSEE